MDHLLLEGAAAIIVVIAGGFFLVASWRARGRGLTAPPLPTSRAATATLIGVPLGGILFIVLLILLANAIGDAPPPDHGQHGHAPTTLAAC